MGDLEKGYSFYASYHNNKINQFIHILCVWPILFTALIFCAYTPSLNGYLPASIALYVPEHVKINLCLLASLRYFFFYCTIEQPGVAGLLAAAFVAIGYLFAEYIVVANPNIWKLSLTIHIMGWLAQFYGHGVHEKRAPALLDNLSQAVIMAPLFVILEVLFIFGYKQSFQDRVAVTVKENMKKFQEQKKNK